MGHALCVCSRGTIIIDNKRYLFIQKLGEGGFSYVDLVEGLHDGHFYALKRILCHEQQDQEEAQREADMHRLFHHPNILRLVAYCLKEWGTKHEAWLLLPFHKRGTLWSEIERLKDKGNFLTEDQILWLLLGICRGLEAIHAKGYAHRDLKPTNILLGDEGQPVLMDLGSMNQARIHVEGSRQALTLQDWAAQRCTISYRAPELFTVQSHCVIDERTDVWAFFSSAAAAGLHDDCGPPAAPSHSSPPQSVGGSAAPSSWPAHYPNLKKPVAILRRRPLVPWKEALIPHWISIHSVRTAFTVGDRGRGLLSLSYFSVLFCSYPQCPGKGKTEKM
ncbi:PREDICTED: serine/threonine-protein kinase 16 isoform X1 [Chinchilla lanigera]|uniref:serine/threonine-protein kinase 16 isoform X1 n=1 Tax=Chinchilla lanigera TaxID=34839 RepID=UPI00038EC36F|nr:PREDICTED: serine/threonine-protein kinase 16 isoform X1 [Chinchilla lanigera]XP_005395629.1 PREDICTED: serine/threonine-protein kinase 16 isoform X1 [Chinchilla lanigera]XP_005395630.1 PREDICTED: serine/threonine-protein kinase 16 isoform X1 [Chinchilla lanigera]XP_005395631.1 PREDICTED: serine/threonine-protein kinase 16 isoform X1 [Chinchilla lanigera]